MGMGIRQEVNTRYVNLIQFCEHYIPRGCPEGWEVHNLFTVITIITLRISIYSSVGERAHENISKRSRFLLTKVMVGIEELKVNSLMEKEISGLGHAKDVSIPS